MVTWDPHPGAYRCLIADLHTLDTDMRATFVWPLMQAQGPFQGHLYPPPLSHRSHSTAVH